MYNIKLNEQIVFLRKEKGVTQENLAQILGVSNQAVSKWETGQCCPDIQLLPELANYFGVSVDELIGYKGIDTSKDIVLETRTVIEELSHGEDFLFTLKLAYVLHAVILSKEMTNSKTGNPGWNTDDVIEHAGKGEWGISRVNLPEFTSYMRMGSVFFSNNSNIGLDNAHLHRICGFFECFSNMKKMKTMVAIYKLTVNSEDVYVTLQKIAEKSELSEDSVKNALDSRMCEYLVENKVDGERQYRIKGMYMHIVPLLAMFSDI